MQPRLHLSDGTRPGITEVVLLGAFSRRLVASRKERPGTLEFWVLWLLSKCSLKPREPQGGWKARAPRNEKWSDDLATTVKPKIFVARDELTSSPLSRTPFKRTLNVKS